MSSAYSGTKELPLGYEVFGLHTSSGILKNTSLRKLDLFESAGEEIGWAAHPFESVINSQPQSTGRSNF
jgi:hypothetical protein